MLYQGDENSLFKGMAGHYKNRYFEYWVGVETVRWVDHLRVLRQFGIQPNNEQLKCLHWLMHHLGRSTVDRKFVNMGNKIRPVRNG